MAIKINQSLKQTQNLAMTPQLQQAIKLLTLTHMEMTNVIAEEMVENPMLEELEGGGGKEQEQKSEVDYKLERLEGQNTEATHKDFNEENELGRKDDFDFEKYIESYSSHSSAAPPSMVGKAGPDDIPNYENIVSQDLTLAEHLEWQLRMENLTPEEWRVAELLIHDINDEGYLEISLEEVCKQTGHDPEDAEEILKMIQSLDPVGCGARNLVECLLAQARKLEPRMPLVERIIADHLELLQEKEWDKMASELGVEYEQVKSAEMIVRALNPKPGRLVSPEHTHYVIPDVYVREVGGEFKVEVNDEGVPRLRISRLYQKMLQEGQDESTREYVQDKLRNALWLLKSIQNRQSTIHRVGEAIVRQQQDFFHKGPAFLRPMILRDIAGDIGMHESTVSRVTSNKYMHTPMGIFELKYFFNVGIGGKKGGIDIAGESLKLKIKQLIEEENPARPLSDQKIVDVLKAQDVVVARRTVTKYREQLGFPASSKRKDKTKGK